MKTQLKIWIALLALLFAGILTSSAEYNEVVNGMKNRSIVPTREGNTSHRGYKGFVEADCTIGYGNYRSNFATLATSQGLMATDWLYLGAGIGMDLAWSTVNAGWGRRPSRYSREWYRHETTDFALMIPIFSDFRFIFGKTTDLSLFLNMRLGAAFLCSDNYLRIKDGFLSDKSYFYMQPAIGVRIPIRKTKPRQAMDIGIHYRVMTAKYRSDWQQNANINGLGLNISYEW